MDEQDRRRIVELVEDAVEEYRDNAGWLTFDRTIIALSQAVASDGDLRAPLYDLLSLAGTRAGSGLHDALEEKRPAPASSRELATRLIHQLGAPVVKDERADKTD